MCYTSFTTFLYNIVVIKISFSLPPQKIEKIYMIYVILYYTRFITEMTSESFLLIK